VLSVAIVTLAAIAAAVSAGLGAEPVSNATLGPEWQCTRLAFVLTTCKRLTRAQAPTATARIDKDCSRRMVLAWRS